ncbi:MAG: hypothetical protein R6V05_08115 [Candidatus Brocadiia bacterium]
MTTTGADREEHEVKQERQATVILGEREIQWVEQAVPDGDAESALEFLREVVEPRMDEALNRPGCKPVFEWDTGEELPPTAPPDGGVSQQ